MLSVKEPIRTARLELRPFSEGDLDDFVAMYSFEEVMRYIYGDVLDEETGREKLAKKCGQSAIQAEGDVLSLAIVLPETGRVIGDIVLKYVSSDHSQGEVGFIVHPDAQGHGYAPEATETLLRLGFEELGLHRICGRCDLRNDASAAVMRKLGMRQEAHFVENEFFKGEWGDELVYAILASEWRAARSGAH